MIEKASYIGIYALICLTIYMFIQIQEINDQQVTISNQIEKLTLPADTVYVNAVQIRYGTRDTIFQMYPIDSAKVAAEYKK